MKKALLALALAAIAFTVFFRPHPPATPPRAPLPPEVASAPTPPAEDPPLVTAVQSSLRDAASLSRIEGELAKGGDPNGVDKSGRTALVHAVRNGDEAATGLLLTRGADPNLRDRSMGWTPLMWAAFLAARDPSYLKLMDALLAKGADPNADINGTTALHIAVNNIPDASKDAAVIEKLLHAGAKPDGVPSTDPSKFSSPPIVLAALNGKMAATLALARGGADVQKAIPAARNRQHKELVAALERLAKAAPTQAPAKKKRR